MESLLSIFLSFVVILFPSFSHIFSHFLTLFLPLIATAVGRYDTNDGSGGGHGGIISSAFTHMRTVSAFSVQFRVSERPVVMLFTRVIR